MVSIIFLRFINEQEPHIALPKFFSFKCIFNLNIAQISAHITQWRTHCYLVFGGSCLMMSAFSLRIIMVAYNNVCNSCKLRAPLLALQHITQITIKSRVSCSYPKESSLLLVQYRAMNCFSVPQLLLLFIAIEVPVAGSVTVFVTGRSIAISCVYSS